MTDKILNALQSYSPTNAERPHYQKIVKLIEETPKCFWRDCFPAHITGSALLINCEGDKVLLNHHKFLDIWMQFGGHADGNADILDVAQRELEEESGVTEFKLLNNGIFDVDTHSIPENSKKAEPSHEHFDIRYLFQCTSNDNFKVSDESVSLRWCTYDEAIHLIHPEDHSVRRMLDKWKEMNT